MFTKKMMARLAQVAPLALVVSLSLSPAFARRSDSNRPKPKGNPSVRIVTLTPAPGSRSGSTIISTVFAGSTSNGRRFDTDGGASGTSSVGGGAGPGGVIEILQPAGPGATPVVREVRDIEVDVDNGNSGRARRLHPRDESDVPLLDVNGGGFPGGNISVEEGAMTSPARSATRSSRLLLPKITHAPIGASARSYSRTQFAVDLNGEAGLSASATFVFGKH